MGTGNVGTKTLRLMVDILYNIIGIFRTIVVKVKKDKTNSRPKT